jgi:hypothetical protein
MLSRVGGELVLTEPKTERSRRRVPLHAGIVTHLKAWHNQQLRERLAAGDQWKPGSHSLRHPAAVAWLESGATERLEWALANGWPGGAEALFAWEDDDEDEPWDASEI